MATPFKDQNEIVAAYLASLGEETEITEKMPFVGQVNKNFISLPKNVKPTSEVVTVTALGRWANKAELASLLMSMVAYKDNIIGFDWKNGSSKITVFKSGTIKQKVLSESEISDLTFTLLNMLKSRRELLGVKWMFADNFIELQYVKQ